MEKELKTLLRKLAAEYETKDFINDDPVRFVHAYADKQDMEIVGFIASWLAYGNRKVIVSTIQALINEMIESLEDKQGIYIRVLTHELCNEYVSFRIFSQGEWDIRY